VTASQVLHSPLASAESPDSLSRLERQDLTASLLAKLADASGQRRDALVQRIVRVNMPVARMLAKRYSGRGISADDLEQVAYLGLVKAARGYDAERGSDFLSYAVPTIRGEIRKHFRDAGWVVRPPRRIQELQSRLWSADAELTQSLHRSPTPSELAAHLDVPLDDVIEALGADGCFVPSSLDLPLGEEDAETVGDRQGGADPAFANCEARVILGPLVRKLGERDRKIVELRFFRGWSQQQIGDEIGVTQMQVSRLLSRILAELRTAIEGRAA
jgi:RNA polymerase sigma-B factor